MLTYSPIQPLFPAVMIDGVEKRGLASINALLNRAPACVKLDVHTKVNKTPVYGYDDVDIEVKLYAITENAGIGGGRQAAIVGNITVHVTNSGNLEFPIKGTPYDPKAVDWAVVIAHPDSPVPDFFAGQVVQDAVFTLFTRHLQHTELYRCGATTAMFAPLNKEKSHQIDALIANLPIDMILATQEMVKKMEHVGNHLRYHGLRVAEGIVGEPRISQLDMRYYQVQWLNGLGISAENIIPWMVDSKPGWLIRLVPDNNLFNIPVESNV